MLLRRDVCREHADEGRHREEEMVVMHQNPLDIRVTIAVNDVGKSKAAL